SGTLCRTLVYDRSGWTKWGWGFHAVDRYSERQTEAVARDGSSLLHIARGEFKYQIIPSGGYNRSRVIVPTKRQTFELEHSRKQYRDLGGVWSFTEMWTDEADCARRATWAGKGWKRTSRDPIIAGIRGIEYLWESSNHSSVQRIAFAPSLGCIAIDRYVGRRNAAGQLVSEDRMTLVSAIIGEPGAGLFSIPSGYQFNRAGLPLETHREAPVPRQKTNEDFPTANTVSESANICAFKACIVSGGTVAG